MRRYRNGSTSALLLCAIIVFQPVLSTAQGQDREEILEEIIVVAPYGARLSRERVAANVQSMTAEEIERSQSLDLTDLLNRNFGSISINHAQNNPLQPDVNFRGFTASPLLGLSPGLTVYQNGVRINEPIRRYRKLGPDSALRRERGPVVCGREPSVWPQHARRRLVAANEERL